MKSSTTVSLALGSLLLLCGCQSQAPTADDNAAQPPAVQQNQPAVDKPVITEENGVPEDQENANSQAAEEQAEYTSSMPSSTAAVMKK